MSWLYLVAFGGGLLYAVRVMLVGVEQHRELDDTTDRSFRLSPAVIAVVVVVFGLAGYALSKSSLPASVDTALAVVIAAIAGFVSARAVKRWWKFVPEHEETDERYHLQGHFARVTVAIGNGVGSEGQVTFVVGSTPHIARARSITDEPVETGTEVVIERIENEVAYVEPWAEVEKRI